MVTAMIDLLKAENGNTQNVHYPITREYISYTQSYSDELNNFLKRSGLSYTTIPDYTNMTIKFTITARNGKELHELAAIQQKRDIVNYLVATSQARIEAKKILLKNVWRKRMGMKELPVPTVYTEEEVVARVVNAYRNAMKITR